MLFRVTLASAGGISKASYTFVISIFWCMILRLYTLRFLVTRNNKKAHKPFRVCTPFILLRWNDYAATTATFTILPDLTSFATA